MGDVPQYKQPALDPSYNVLLNQAKQDELGAEQSAVNRETNSLTARFGALTSGDMASILARYGSNLALGMAQSKTQPAPGMASLHKNVLGGMGA